MTTSTKAAGLRFEADVFKFLQAAGAEAARPRQTTAQDVGDIHVGADVVVQAKAWANLAAALREGTAGAQVQAERARRRFGVAVIKKPRAPIAEAYVVMPLRVFAEFLQARQSPGVKTPQAR